MLTDMKLLVAASLMSLVCIAHAGSQESQPTGSGFSGPYIGFKFGVNLSNASGNMNTPTHSTIFPGLAAGYGFDLGQFMIGGEAFADFHHGSTTYKDAGADLKVGMPLGNVMPYARMGLTGSWPDTRWHGGFGVEYKLHRQISLAGEWTSDSSRHEGTQRRNNSFTAGLMYYF